MATFMHTRGRKAIPMASGMWLPGRPSSGQVWAARSHSIGSEAANFELNCFGSAVSRYCGKAI